jgi:hypothetical protein
MAIKAYNPSAILIAAGLSPSEKFLHKKYRAYRIFQEWFDLPFNIAQDIAELLNNSADEYIERKIPQTATTYIAKHAQKEAVIEPYILKIAYLEEFIKSINQWREFHRFMNVYHECYTDIMHNHITNNYFEKI